ncbi:MAG: hypothetical protein HQK96_06930 [Nitrospirae bacterium]|nr:hypothetical protein [Nitrospirota bacterium]
MWKPKIPKGFKRVLSGKCKMEDWVVCSKICYQGWANGMIGVWVTKEGCHRGRTNKFNPTYKPFPTSGNWRVYRKSVKVAKKAVKKETKKTVKKTEKRK